MTPADSQSFAGAFVDHRLRRRHQSRCLSVAVICVITMVMRCVLINLLFLHLMHACSIISLSDWLASTLPATIARTKRSLQSQSARTAEFLPRRCTTSEGEAAGRGSRVNYAMLCTDAIARHHAFNQLFGMLISFLPLLFRRRSFIFRCLRRAAVRNGDFDRKTHRTNARIPDSTPLNESDNQFLLPK